MHSPSCHPFPILPMGCLLPPLVSLLHLSYISSIKCFPTIRASKYKTFRKTNHNISCRFKTIKILQNSMEVGFILWETSCPQALLKTCMCTTNSSNCTTYIPETATKDVSHIWLRLMFLMFLARCRCRALTDDMFQCDAHLHNHR